MSAVAPRRDLVVLVADKSIALAISGLLQRTQALGVRRIDCEIRIHQQHDPGCRVDAAAFLRPYASQFEHALVVFDRDGCGSDAPRQEIEERVESELLRSGWGRRACAVVIDPELEVWVWTPSGSLANELGWGTRFAPLREWMRENGHWPAEAAKPPDPKRAMEAAMRARRRPKSASTFRRLAEVLRFQHCSDGAFLKLDAVLTEWFGEPLRSEPQQPDAGTESES
jgi:hypothetical protein